MGRVSPLPLPSTTPTNAGYGAFRSKQGPSGTWHWGIDIAPQKGQAGAVIAPESGVIHTVWTSDKAPFTGYGPAGVILKGDSGVFHLLAHLTPDGWSTSSKPNVGQRFDEGEQIGLIATGLTPSQFWAAPHVHWEVRVLPVDSPATRKGNTLDPLQWLAGNDVLLTRPGSWPWYLWVIVGYVAYRHLQR